MPELPEVETVRRKLSDVIIGRTIEDIDVLYPKYAVLSEIKNQKIEGIDRYGKYLIFNLTSYHLISHLRMEGKYSIEENYKMKKHDLAVFHLDKAALVYNDTRKFGVFYLFDKNVDIMKLPPLSSLGREPFTADKDYLLKKLEGKSSLIKSLLLDQSILTGLGNIYVDEVLFASKINPYKKGKEITEKEVLDIITNAKNILAKAITMGGTTIRTYESLNGETGHYQGELIVHEKEGQNCPVCGNIIMKSKVGGRGTYFCPTCQKNHPVILIAITGSFASGKSSVLSFISSLGFETYSMDEIARNLYSSSKEMLNALKKAFKTTDKKELAELAIKSEKDRLLLEKITHRYILEEFNQRVMSSFSKVIFAEVPLLYEGGYENMFDYVIDVYETDKVKDKIINAKNLTTGYLKELSRTQLDKEEKRKRADYVIINDSTLENLKENTIKIIKEMEAMNEHISK
ncbi:MAG: DNA-formamidopyrimidine glycosylase [Bacillales bacterium]|nr:DNA-formamidopyrimidine glycosylase [Bacillales bacterium]